MSLSNSMDKQRTPSTYHKTATPRGGTKPHEPVPQKQATATTSIGTSSIQQKINIPCRYYKLGTCKLGEQCRFLHSGKPAEVPRKTVQATIKSTVANGASEVAGQVAAGITASAGNTSNTNNGAQSNEGEFCTTPPAERWGRRPFLQIVVLYASDSRVLKYAKDVQSTFLDNGVDVYLQTEWESPTSSDQKGSNSSSKPYFDRNPKDIEIKSENLAEIISASCADFLTVIGDRNMKNRSCQAKRRGKLIEMDVEELIRTIWAEWAPYQDTDGNGEAKLSPARLDQLLSRYANIRNFNDRFQRAENLLSEVYTLHNEKPRTQKKETGAEDTLSSKLVTCQKSLIRLHLQLQNARQVFENIEEGEQIVVDQSQFGSKVGPDYNPAAVHSSKLPYGIRDRVLQAIDNFLSRFTNDFEPRLQEIGAPLWNSYVERDGKLVQLNGNEVLFDDDRSTDDTTDPTSESTDDSMDASQPPSSDGAEETTLDTPTTRSEPIVELLPGQWQCEACTFINEAHDVSECRMCFTARPKSDANEWIAPTQGKKQRHKQHDPEAAKKPVAAPVNVSTTKTAPVTVPKKPTPASSAPTKKAPQSIGNNNTPATQPASAASSTAPGSSSSLLRSPVLSNRFPPLESSSLAPPSFDLSSSSTATNSATDDTATGVAILNKSNPQEYEASFPPLGAPVQSTKKASKSTYKPIGTSAATTESISTLQTSSGSTDFNSHLHLSHGSERYDVNPLSMSADSWFTGNSIASMASQQMSMGGPYSPSPAPPGSSMPLPSPITSKYQSKTGPDSSASHVVANLFSNSYTSHQRPTSQMSLPPTGSPHLSSVNTYTSSHPDFSHISSLWGNSGITNPVSGSPPTGWETWLAAFQEPPGMPHITSPQRKYLRTRSLSLANTVGSNVLYGSSPPLSSPSPSVMPNVMPAPRYGHSSSTGDRMSSSTSNGHVVSSVNTPLNDVNSDALGSSNLMPKTPQYVVKPGVQRPCCYCGEESSIECNLCAKMGMVTYFCSVQHQTLVWKQHMLYHKPVYLNTAPQVHYPVETKNKKI